MVKYFKSIMIAIVIGVFLSIFFLKQYKDYSGIKVVAQSNNIYFIQYGVYSDKKSMEDNTIQLFNYIYNKIDDKYYVYVGITSNDENKDKIVNYYKNFGYDTTVKEYGLNNQDFLNKLKSFDDILKNTDDVTTISQVLSKTLETYKEVVINGSKN